MLCLTFLIRIVSETVKFYHVIILRVIITQPVRQIRETGAGHSLINRASMCDRRVSRLGIIGQATYYYTVKHEIIAIRRWRAGDGKSASRLTQVCQSSFPEDENRLKFRPRNSSVQPSYTLNNSSDYALSDGSGGRVYAGLVITYATRVHAQMRIVYRGSQCPPFRSTFAINRLSVTPLESLNLCSLLRSTWNGSSQFCVSKFKSYRGLDFPKRD